MDNQNAWISPNVTGGVSDAYKKRVKELAEEIKELRVQMDATLKAVKSLISSRYTSLAITSLELSRMWLGKALGTLNVPYPYPESNNPESSEIKPPVDVSDDINVIPEEYRMGQVASIKFLRQRVGLHAKQAEMILGRLAPAGSWGFEGIFAFQHAMEANMWLGARLGELREK